MLSDQTISMLRRGYAFRSGVFDTGDDRGAVPLRFLGMPALFVTGEPGARLFYDETRLTRVGAVPPAVGNLIFGRGGVQGLDGDAHLSRRRIFLDTLDHEGIVRLTDIVRRRWQDAQRRWVAAGSVSLHGAAVEVLGDSVLEWAGVRSLDDTATMAGDLCLIVDGFGPVGPANVRGRLARRRCERVARVAIEEARRSTPPGTAESPLQVVARARDSDGELLDTATAAVELLNLLRPVVAITYFIDFSAVALVRWPTWPARVSSDGHPVDRRPAE